MNETETIRILHVEDDPADAELIGLALLRSDLPCEIRVVHSRRECLQALESDAFDLVLSDSHGHDFTAVNILRLVREHLPETPFIFVSGSFDDSDPGMLEAEGATDCILKDDLDALLPAIRRALAIRG